MITLDKLKSLSSNATPGPWHSYDSSVVWEIASGPKWICNGYYSSVPLEGWEQSMLSPQDAAFIAASRDAIPLLIEEVERLRAELETIADKRRHFRLNEFPYQSIGEEQSDTLIELAEQALAESKERLPDTKVQWDRDEVEKLSQENCC